MPPKRSHKPKPDWILCPKSGLLFHSADLTTHTSWLERDTSTTSPTHPHIISGKFNSTINLVSPSALSISLPPQVLFSSVFVSPCVAKHCALGQASLVMVRVNNTELVLTMFTVPTLSPTQISCTSNSWLASISVPNQEVSMEMFTGEVEMCKEVEVIMAGDIESANLIESDSDKFRAAIKFHLTGVLIRTECVLPFLFYGTKLKLKLKVSLKDQTELVSDIESLSLNSDSSPQQHSNTSYSIPSNAVTSTPHKTHPSLFSSSCNSSTFYRVSMTTKLLFPEIRTNDISSYSLPFVGGLDQEIDTISTSLRMVLNQGTRLKRILTGLLLYGPPGTGKSLLAQHLPVMLGVKMIRIAGPELYSKFYGETEAQLRVKFEEAVRDSPSILFIDEVDSLAPRGENGGSDQERRVLATLVTLLDRLNTSSSKVVVIAATSRLEGVDPSLRRPGRLDMEVEIGVPNVNQRREILSGMLDEQEKGHKLVQEEVGMIAGNTHGFVGADLQSLVSLATMAAKEMKEDLSMRHMKTVMPKVKPSAMREVMVEVPQVSWTDIGGLDDLKLKLRQAVEWPIKHPEIFTRMGISAPRGLLMYGPPGCSKTMIAKALANESGLNFLSIKGPELFSKWVGESERAVREVFRKARQVKPSIVFFDEIDAIGGARGGGGGGGKVGDRVLAQLLTEMDGVEGLQGVTVVAATNRPDMMDQALLRPGRLDRVVYVPLPDIDTRRKVLEVHTRTKPLSDAVNLDQIAEKTDGYSGAEIAAICNEAALAALEESVTANKVTETHFERALAVTKPRISAELFTVYEKFQAAHSSKTV